MDEPRTLHRLTSQVFQGSRGNKRICLVVDQFEELFTICRDKAHSSVFVENLCSAAAAPLGRTVVVLTMRADFYGNCATYPALAAAMADSQVLVGPMTEHELRQAIEGPAYKAGYEFEAGLVELLLQDASFVRGCVCDTRQLVVPCHAILVQQRQRRAARTFDAGIAAGQRKVSQMSDPLKSTRPGNHELTAPDRTIRSITGAIKTAGDDGPIIVPSLLANQ